MTITRRRFVLSSSLAAGAAALLPRQMPAQAADLSDWKNVQRLFNLAPELTHAALFFLASHPKPVRDAIETWRAMMDRDPVETVEEGMFASPEQNQPIKVCESIGRYIGADPNDIALTPNTTTGLALAYHGLPLEPGDEVLTSEHDHMVHHESIRLANVRSGATMRKIRLFAPHDASEANATAIVNAYRDAISPKTRVLGITWVHSSSGLKLPLASIGDMVAKVNASRPPSERITVVCDAVHGLGADEPHITAIGIDVVASGLHKWMLGPRGTGFLWAKPEVWARMRPVVPSFSTFELFGAWMEERAPRGPARASWFSPGGFLPYEYQWAVPAAIALHKQLGSARVMERIHALNGAAKQELANMPHVKLRTPRGSALSAGIIAFEVDGLAPEAVVAKLKEKKVIASTSPYRVTYPRLSFGIANSEQDVERAVAAVRALRA